jgi:hypothetical protein
MMPTGLVSGSAIKQREECELDLSPRVASFGKPSLDHLNVHIYNAGPSFSIIMLYDVQHSQIIDLKHELIEASNIMVKGRSSLSLLKITIIPFGQSVSNPWLEPESIIPSTCT